MSDQSNFPSIKIGNNGPVDPSSILDLTSISAGMLPPRMSAVQISGIVNPATGLLAFNTTTQQLNQYTSSGWGPIAGTGGGGSGTVTSVGLSLPNIFNVSGSPITGSGTITASLANESANQIFSGPISGSSSQPTFRSLVINDIPSGLSYVASIGLTEGSTNPIFNIANSPITGSGNIVETLRSQSINTVFAGPSGGASGQPLFRQLVSGDIPALGYVTSVGLSLPNIFSVSGTPVTGSGTLTASLATESAKTVFAGPTGGSAAIPTFRTLVSGDIPSLSGTYLPLAGGTMSGPINMGSNLINSLSPGVAGTDAVNLNQLNNAVAGVNPAVAVQAATTSASNTSGFTYNNGVSGIGATFTGSVNTPITIDGYTFTALNQRLLIKNDTQSPAGAFNGIYYVTQVQTALLAPILTRALDYDQPSDINNTGAIPVINGTVNGTTQWVLTSLVNTVGTDPLTYTQFSKNPSSYLLATNNLSDVSSSSTSFNNISPMTTLGDIIYENSTPSGTRLAGNTTTTKNFLTQTGNGSNSAAPAWGTISLSDLPSGSSSSSYGTAYFGSASSWSTTSPPFVDPTNSGGNSITIRQSSGITITAGGSNVCGITFTPSSASAIYFISAVVGVFSNGSAGNIASLQMTDGTTVIGTAYWQAQNGSGDSASIPIEGIYVPGTSSAVTVKIQLGTSAGTAGIIGAGSGNPVEWTITQIPTNLIGTSLSLNNFGSSPNAQGASVSSSTLTLQPASATFPGGVTTGSQTFAGVKTFSSAPVFNAPLAVSSGGTGFTDYAANAIMSSSQSASGTGGSLVSVNNMSFGINSNETWSFEFYTSSFPTVTTHGVVFGINGPSGATVFARVFGNTTTAGTYTLQNITSLNSATSSFNAVTGITGFTQIAGTMIASATSGTCQLQFAPVTTSDAVTIVPGSYMVARRIS